MVIMIGVLVMAVALPITTKLVQQNQENRSNAACISKEGVNTFSVNTPCNDGFRYMEFTCYDGFSKREGGPTSCKSSAVWKSYAETSCKGHSSICDANPVPASCSRTVDYNKDGVVNTMDFVYCLKEKIFLR